MTGFWPDSDDSTLVCVRRRGDVIDSRTAVAVGVLFIATVAACASAAASASHPSPAEAH